MLCITLFEALNKFLFAFKNASLGGSIILGCFLYLFAVLIIEIYRIGFAPVSLEMNTLAGERKRCS